MKCGIEISQMFLVESLSGISSAWRRNQRIFTCEFDLVIRICQYGNHVTQNVFSKEV